MSLLPRGDDITSTHQLQVLGYRMLNISLTESDKVDKPAELQLEAWSHVRVRSPLQALQDVTVRR